MKSLYLVFQHYRAVLLIPDIYNRQHVREMMNILLNRLGFSAAFAVQVSTQNQRNSLAPGIFE